MSHELKDLTATLKSLTNAKLMGVLKLAEKENREPYTIAILRMEAASRNLI